MTVPIASAAAPVPPVQEGPSANLFEWAAAQAQAGAAGSSVNQVAQGLMQRLDAFMVRTREFSGLQNSPGGVYAAAPPGSSAPTPGPAPTATAPGPANIDQTLGSLRLMFDHSIETQLVVRSATQISGSVNTLLRGQ
jgi:hypothetical protein